MLDHWCQLHSPTNLQKCSSVFRLFGAKPSYLSYAHKKTEQLNLSIRKVNLIYCSIGTFMSFMILLL